MTGLTRKAPLAREAASALERRETQYPALVAAGKITADQASREIRVWRAIAADWHWVATMERREVEPATLHEKLAALEDSVRRSLRALRKIVDNSPSQIRRPYMEGMPLWQMQEKFGEAFAEIFHAHCQHERIEDLLSYQRDELPDSGRFPIAWWVEANHALKERARQEREGRVAA